MTAILPALITVAILVALHLLRSAGRARKGSSYNHALLLKHRAINQRHLRNGGVLVQTLFCMAFGHALVLILWAIAYGVMSITEPRW